MKKKRDAKPIDYCIGCAKCLGFRCDILGEITEEQIELCKRAGYRELKYSNYSYRHYCNKVGDRYDTEQGR